MAPQSVERLEHLERPAGTTPWMNGQISLASRSPWSVSPWGYGLETPSWWLPTYCFIGVPSVPPPPERFSGKGSGRNTTCSCAFLPFRDPTTCGQHGRQTGR